MSLSELPVEIFRGILAEAVRLRGWKRAMRLRLVNKFFSEQLVEALNVLGEMQVGESSMCMWPWLRPYLERRLLGRRTQTLPRLHTLEKIATILATDSGAQSSFEVYALRMLHQAPVSDKSIRQLFQSTNSGEDYSFKENLLAAAVLTNHASLVVTLVDSGMGTNSLWNDTHFGDPLTAAVRARNYTILDFLMLRTKSSRQALHSAIKQGDLEMVIHILNMKDTPADPWQGFSPRPLEKPRQMSWRRRASKLGTPSVEVFNIMLAELQFRRLVIVSNEFWDAALLNAAWCGWTDMVKHLISRGASLEWPEHEYLKSPLYRACRYGHEGVVRVLLDNGAEPFRPDFETAATHGHFSTLKLLLEIQPVFQPSLTKNCLYAAARKGFLAIVRLLLDFGADPNGGETAPLIGAVEAEHVIIFRLLVQWGADVPSVQAEASKRAEAAGLESMLALLNENHVI